MSPRRLLAVLALVLATLLGGGMPALAQDDLASAKAQGLVGERPDGLVGTVADAVPAPVAALVERVNAERRKQYGQVAQSTGRPVQEVQAIAGDKLVANTPSGQYVMNAAGRWVKK
ncbi:YdbL family protein [Aerophototrophica crusticola]|uniref:YdbL family protein n=1 Tax=Aerophototrophica crusticola TaxID=1709002 RepID=A0A858R5H3_9PROT|nr:YdbL family protein [Rhodospirillaceae bacterium B3]